jgi:hypothetical protein
MAGFRQNAEKICVDSFVERLLHQEGLVLAQQPVGGGVDPLDFACRR